MSIKLPKPTSNTDLDLGKIHVFTDKITHSLINIGSLVTLIGAIPKEGRSKPNRVIITIEGKSDNQPAVYFPEIASDITLDYMVSQIEANKSVIIKSMMELSKLIPAVEPAQPSIVVAEAETTIPEILIETE